MDRDAVCQPVSRPCLRNTCPNATRLLANCKELFFLSPSSDQYLELKRPVPLCWFVSGSMDFIPGMDKEENLLAVEPIHSPSGLPLGLSRLLLVTRFHGAYFEAEQVVVTIRFRFET
jgi:hypothetical protein